MKRPLVIALLVIALAFVCLGIGAVAFFTVNRNFSINDPFDNRNISSVLEESKALKVDPEKPLTLKVVDQAGAVTVRGADVDTVQVTAVKTAYDSTQARADQEVKGIKYTIQQTGNSVTLRYEIPDSMNFRNKLNTVDFLVTLPAQADIDVDAGAGEVSVSDVRGDVNIVNDFGSVTAENITGPLAVETQSGRVKAASVNAGRGSIELASGFGNVALEDASSQDIKLRSQSGALQVRDVRASGSIEMSTDFGDVTLEGGSGEVLTLETRSGKVTLSRLTLRGALTVTDGFGTIDLEQVEAASYDLQTQSGSVTVDGAAGRVKAHSGLGSVTVRNAEEVTLDLSTQSGPIDFEGSLGEGPHEIHSDFGEISLAIPADSALDIDLQTDFGTIRSDIPITVTLSGEADKNRQTGTMNGGGAQLTVDTQSGGISIQASR